MIYLVPFLIAFLMPLVHRLEATPLWAFIAALAAGFIGGLKSWSLLLTFGYLYASIFAGIVCLMLFYSVGINLKSRFAKWIQTK